MEIHQRGIDGAETLKRAAPAGSSDTSPPQVSDAFGDKIDQLTRQDQELDGKSAELGKRIQTLKPRRLGLEIALNIGIVGAFVPTLAALLTIPGAQIPALAMLGLELAGLFAIRCSADKHSTEIYLKNKDISQISSERKTISEDIEFLKGASKGLSTGDEIGVDEQFVTIDGVKLPKQKEGLFRYFRHILLDDNGLGEGLEPKGNRIE